MSTQTTMTQEGSSVERLTFLDVVRQFKRDVYDKEVQSAATYSYLWLADQMGHIGLGILLTIVLGLVFQLLPVSNAARILWPFGLALFGCAYWEYSAFQTYRAQTTGRFPPDTEMLKSNAMVAALYMFLGIALGISWQCALLFSEKHFLWPGRYWSWLGVGVTLICTVVALGVAYPWVRQKMIWQKAGMPFLFRLADTRNTVSDEDAKKLQAYADSYLRPKGDRATHTPVVVISGPLWAGKTSLACGIGTEAAFKKLRVRYLTFDKLAQMAASNRDDLGPRNILYWRWKKSEVVIIDDINTGTFTDNFNDLETFKSITADYGLPNNFAGRVSVWVIGPKKDDELPAWEEAIANVCRSADSSGNPLEPEMMTVRLYLPATLATPGAAPAALP